MTSISRDLFPYNVVDDNTAKEYSDPASCYDVNDSCCSISDCNYTITQQVEGFINEKNAFV